MPKIAPLRVVKFWHMEFESPSKTEATIHLPYNKNIVLSIVFLSFLQRHVATTWTFMKVFTKPTSQKSQTLNLYSTSHSFLGTWQAVKRPVGSLMADIRPFFFSYGHRGGDDFNVSCSYLDLGGGFKSFFCFHPEILEGIFSPIWRSSAHFEPLGWFNSTTDPPKRGSSFFENA